MQVKIIVLAVADACELIGWEYRARRAQEYAKEHGILLTREDVLNA